MKQVANQHLPLDTSREKIEQAVSIIRTALQEHEGMTPEYPPRVYFNEFVILNGFHSNPECMGESRWD